MSDSDGKYIHSINQYEINTEQTNTKHPETASKLLLVEPKRFDIMFDTIDLPIRMKK